jgi:hypothetical protein
MPNPNIWKPDYGLRALIAHSNSFCYAVGAYTIVGPDTIYNPTAAMAHIFGAVDDDFPEARACVTVNNMVRKNIGIGNWRSDGSLMVLLERKYPQFEISDKATFDSQEALFTQWCSDVWLEMEAKLDSRAVLTIDTVSYNPLAIHSVNTDGQARLVPASECPQYDDEDSGTAAASKRRSWWYMMWEVSLY